MTHAEKSPKIARGFTLIEVLVAMMILSISLTVILQLFSGGLKAAGMSENYTRAVFYAREQMEAILLAEEFESGTWKGEFDDDFRWKSDIVWLEPSEEEKDRIPLDIFSITVKVIWNEGPNEKSFEIGTLKLAEKKKPEDDKKDGQK